MQRYAASNIGQNEGKHPFVEANTINRDVRKFEKDLVPTLFEMNNDRFPTRKVLVFEWRFIIDADPDMLPHRRNDLYIIDP